MNKKQQRQQKLQRQQALLNAAREANRTLSAEEQAVYYDLTPDTDPQIQRAVSAATGVPVNGRLLIRFFIPLPP